MGGRGSKGAGRGRGRPRKHPGGPSAPSSPSTIPPSDDGGGSVKPSPGPGGDGGFSDKANPTPSDQSSRPGSSSPPSTATSDQSAGGSAPQGGGIPAVHWTDDVARKAVDDHATADGFAADVAAVNPDYDRTDPASSENCQRCVAAADMRARGYDVSADLVPQTILDATAAYKANPQNQVLFLDWNAIDDRDSSGIIAKYSFNGVPLSGGASSTSIAVLKPGETLGMGEYAPGGSVAPRRVFNFIPKGSVASRQAVDAAVLGWGDGARGFLAVQWRKGSGHVFMVENRGGVVIYYDGQNNRVDASSSWANVKQSDYTNGLLRVDDLTPNESMMNWVHNREVP